MKPMKKSKLLALFLSLCMIVGLVPMLIVPASAAESYMLPGRIVTPDNLSNTEYYMSAVQNSTRLTINKTTKITGAVSTTNTNGYKYWFDNSSKYWYTANGVMFAINQVNSGTWASDEGDETTVGTGTNYHAWFDFSIQLVTKTQTKLTGYDKDGIKPTDGKARSVVFWTNDQFHNNKAAANNSSVASAVSTYYWSTDGTTWQHNTKSSGNNCYYFDLTANVGDENATCYFYVPFSSFYFYGVDANSGNPVSGTDETPYKEGYKTFAEGIEYMKKSGLTVDEMTLSQVKIMNRFSLGTHYGSLECYVDSMSLVYDVMDTASVTAEDDLSMNLYINQPDRLSSNYSVVTAQLGENDPIDITSTGVRQDDGRMKYTFEDILPQQIEETITFTWEYYNSSNNLVKRLRKTTSIQSYLTAVLDTAGISEETATLAKTLWNYCRKVQIKTRGSTTLTEKSVTNQTIANLTAPYENTDTSLWKKATLVLDGQLILQITLTPPDGVTQVQYTVEDRAESDTTTIADGKVLIALNAQELGKAVTLYCWNGSSTTGARLVISANYYLKVADSNESLSAEAELRQSIANYGVAAAAYASAS